MTLLDQLAAELETETVRIRGVDVSVRAVAAGVLAEAQALWSREHEPPVPGGAGVDDPAYQIAVTRFGAELEAIHLAMAIELDCGAPIGAWAAPDGGPRDNDHRLMWLSKVVGEVLAWPHERVQAVRRAMSRLAERDLAGEAEKKSSAAASD